MYFDTFVSVILKWKGEMVAVCGKIEVVILIKFKTI
jgi:hypothetical protein